MAEEIFETIAAYAGQRVLADMEVVGYDQMVQMALNLPRSSHRFSKTLEKQGMSFICEIKKASPFEEEKDPVFNYKETARSYDRAGADCISCLTEPKWFMGSDQVFTDIRNLTRLPMIRRDFIVDAYQIYQAKTMGADAVQLICRLMDEGTLSYYLSVCDDLGIDALVEAHDEDEIRMAVSAGAKVICAGSPGMNAVDREKAAAYRRLIPEGCIYVAEGGVKTPEDAAFLHSIGADAVMLGGVLNRTEDAQAMLDAMRRACI